MGVMKPDAPEYFWYQKLRVLKEEVGELNERFDFWAGLIGGSDYQELIKTSDFCSLGQPFELEWTLENLVSYGSKEVLDSWAKAQCYKRYCTDE